MRFGRLMTAMVTPFKEDLSVDYDAASALATRLVDNGSDGLVITGTTGESCTLTMDESVQLYKTVKSAVGGRASVIAGSGSNSTEEALFLTQGAEKAGVDGSLQISPYYNKPSQEGFLKHFSTIAASTSLPLILYNIPGRTGKNVEADTVIRLSAIDNIVGVKEASGDLQQVSDIISGTPDDFLVYSGDDFMTMPLMSVGGYGVVSVASHLAGNDIKAMIEAFVNGDITKAVSLHQKLAPLFKVLFINSNPIPLKAALNIAGINVGSLRSPLVEATDQEKAKIRNVLSELGLV